VTAPGLELRDVRFGYGPWQVAYDLVVESGTLTALIGASGAGKSTLLSLVAGFETPATGAILVDGADVTALPPAERPVTTLFQDHNLFPHLDILRNVGLGIDPSLRLKSEDTDACRQALAKVGLAGREDRLPQALSGGERQRAAIARALVMRRPLLLLDEPFAGLGPALRRDMLDLVDDLRRDTGMTVLMVSHEPRDALRIAGQAAFVHEGTILAQGPAHALLTDPPVPELAAYLGVD